MTPRTDIRTQLLTSFAKSGPWAVLCFLMLAGLGWGGKALVQYVGPAAENYLRVAAEATAKNSENMEVLSASQARSDAQHTDMQSSLTVLQDTLEQRHQEHLAQNEAAAERTRQLEEVLLLLQDAHDRMKDVPGQRAEQLVLSKEQTSLLREVLAGIKNLARVEAAVSEGPE